MSTPTRLLQQLFFRFGIRPAALLVVMGSGVLVFSMLRIRRSEFVAPAVTQATSAALASVIAARVARVHVSLGQRVRAGQLLATLSAPELESERDEVDARIRRLARAAEVAQLDLMRGLHAEQREALARLGEVQGATRRAEAEAEREGAEATAAVSFLAQAEQLVKAGMLAPDVAAERALVATRESAQQREAGAVLEAERRRVGALRRDLGRMDAPKGLVEATAELYEAELEVLQRRRSGLLASLTLLSLKSPVDGVVAEILPEGSVALAGATVARVVPPFASDVVAFAPASAPPSPLTGKVPFSVMLADGRECNGKASPRTTGELTRKPEQLVGPGGFGAFGFALSVALGSNCRLPIGQIVELRLSTH